MYAMKHSSSVVVLLLLWAKMIRIRFSHVHPRHRQLHDPVTHSICKLTRQARTLVIILVEHISNIYRDTPSNVFKLNWPTGRCIRSFLFKKFPCKKAWRIESSSLQTRYVHVRNQHKSLIINNHLLCPTLDKALVSRSAKNIRSKHDYKSLKTHVRWP